MKIKNYSGTEERTILTALIVHDGVLQRVYQKVGTERELFRSRWSNLVAKWSFQHFEKYARAPRQYISVCLKNFAASTNDEESVDLLEGFLAGLSRDYAALAEETNELYVTDLAARYFDKVRLERLASTVQEACDKNDVVEARKLWQSYESVDFSGKTWVDPFAPDEVKDTFRYYEEDRVLIKFPGALGKFLSPAFERDGFIAFAGPEKRGKSYWLGEVVWLGLKQRRRVLYYVLGDMSVEQVKRRLYVRSALRPMRAQELNVPVHLEVDADGEPDIRHQRRAYEALSPRDVDKARAKVQALTATKHLRLRLLCAGGGTLCAGNIEQDVAQFTKEDWVPDLVVVDYADELAAEPSSAKLDKRHQINENWRVLRRIALQNHCLVVTATQAAARSYDSRVIRKKDFSEDKRKNAHVTGMVGINQFGEEKKNGIYRLNWIFLRDGAWTENQTVWTAGNLALAAPALMSALR